MTRLYSKENIKFKHNIKYIPWVDQLAVFPEENQEQDVVQDNIWLWLWSKQQWHKINSTLS